jgi:biopolymer transport protein ExbD
MAGSVRSKGPISDINVTPLVDVMMVLLVLFMLVAQLDDENQTAAVPIALPQAATAESTRDRQPLTVAVTATGQYALSGKVVGRDEIIAAVRQALQRQPDLEVAVGADRATSHERFVALLDLLRAEGVSRFAIQTDARGG